MTKKRRPSAATPPVSAHPAPSSAPKAEAPAEPTPATANGVWVDRALVVIAVLIVFGRTLAYPLVASWDDRRFLIDNPLVQHPSFEALRSIFLEPHFEAYHPLHLLSYWVDVPWLGPVGWAVRTTNLLLFAGVGVLLLTWLRQLGLGRWPALIATLAFVLHPVQVELVVWGTGRKDALAVLFALASWVLHLRSRDLWDRSAWGARVLFLCACLAKTSAVPLPLAMLALDVCLKRRPWREAIATQLPSFTVAIALGIATIWIWSSNDMIRPIPQGGSSAMLVLTSLTHAITTAAWPSSTSPLYALVDDDPPSAAWAALGSAVVIALAFVAYRSRAEPWARWLGGGLAVFLALFLPVANILPTYFHFQDRHLSLPFLGLALVLGALLSALAPSTATAAKAPGLPVVLAATLCVIPLAARTVQYEAVWSSDVRLWSHATATHPRSFFAWVKLGEVLRDAGRYDGAIEAYTNAIEIQPSARLAYTALLMAMAMRDERDEDLPPPSRAEAIAERYARHADDARQLRIDADEMVAQGYRMAALLVLSRSLDLEPPSEERLERAAQWQLDHDHEWIARFYVGRMTRRPILPPVARFFDEERERLGIHDPPPPEEHIPLQVPVPAPEP